MKKPTQAGKKPTRAHPRSQTKTPTLPARGSAAWTKQRLQMLRVAEVGLPKQKGSAREFCAELPAPLYEAVDRYARHFNLTVETFIIAAAVCQLNLDKKGGQS